MLGYKKVWQNLDEQYYCQVLLYMGESYRLQGNINDAVCFLEQNIEEYSKVFQYSYQFKSHLYHNLGIYKALQNDGDGALDAFKHHVYYSLINNQAYENYEFYSFRSCSDYAIDDLKNGTITVANPHVFNDPFDCLIYPWLEEKKIKTKEEYNELAAEQLIKAYQYVKVRCFVRNLPLPQKNKDAEKVEERYNMLMWSHYADSHKGFCVKYQFPKEFTMNNDNSTCILSRLDNVKYESERKSLEQGLTLNEAFFTKSDVWKYENEVRFLHYDPNVESDFKSIKIDKNRIREIYFGLNCTEENQDKIREAVKGISVHFYKIGKDPDNIYELTSNPLF